MSQCRGRCGTAIGEKVGLARRDGSDVPCLEIEGFAFHPKLPLAAKEDDGEVVRLVKMRLFRAPNIDEMLAARFPSGQRNRGDLLPRVGREGGEKVADIVTELVYDHRLALAAWRAAEERRRQHGHRQSLHQAAKHRHNMPLSRCARKSKGAYAKLAGPSGSFGGAGVARSGGRRGGGPSTHGSRCSSKRPGAVFSGGEGVCVRGLERN